MKPEIQANPWLGVWQHVQMPGRKLFLFQHDHVACLFQLSVLGSTKLSDAEAVSVGAETKRFVVLEEHAVSGNACSLAKHKIGIASARFGDDGLVAKALHHEHPRLGVEEKLGVAGGKGMASSLRAH
jgi:hypothetical protein